MEDNQYSSEHERRIAQLEKELKSNDKLMDVLRQTLIMLLNAVDDKLKRPRTIPSRSERRRNK